MKKSKQLMFTLSIFIFLMGFTINVSAQEGPQLPHLFYGDSKVDGEDTPAGTVIIAKVNGEEKGRIITSETGKYGGPAGNQDKLVVQGNIDDATIEFYISTIKANQTASFDSGEIEELNLTWSFPEVIVIEGDVSDEPILCLEGTNITINNDGLTINITCSETSPATIVNISNIGTSFLVGAPSPSGVENLSDAQHRDFTTEESHSACELICSYLCLLSWLP